MISSTAIQKFGTDKPEPDDLNHRFHAHAARHAREDAERDADERDAHDAQERQFDRDGSRDTSRSPTGWPDLNDTPKLPWSMLASQSPYCTTGRSRPNSCITAARCAALNWPSLPARMSRIVPGSRRTSTKIRTETPSNAASVQSERRRR